MLNLARYLKKKNYAMQCSIQILYLSISKSKHNRLVRGPDQAGYSTLLNKLVTNHLLISPSMRKAEFFHIYDVLVKTHDNTCKHLYLNV